MIFLRIQYYWWLTEHANSWACRTRYQFLQYYWTQHHYGQFTVIVIIGDNNTFFPARSYFPFELEDLSAHSTLPCYYFLKNSKEDRDLHLGQHSKHANLSRQKLNIVLIYVAWRMIILTNWSYDFTYSSVRVVSLPTWLGSELIDPCRSSLLQNKARKGSLSSYSFSNSENSPISVGKGSWQPKTFLNFLLILFGCQKILHEVFVVFIRRSTEDNVFRESSICFPRANYIVF